MSDTRYMRLALEWARRGLNTTTPNPRVGCILVNGDEVVGEGFHERAGEPHAEINALRAAGERARGATAYVTLEPCAHHGRTGPCSEALIAAGVTTVVYGMQDPNPAVAGAGITRLVSAGLTVRGPVLEYEARALNPGFIKRMLTARPWVRLKLGMSLDARTAMANGESQWITGSHARQDVQRWRARSCAIITGVDTVLADDPALTVRDPQFGTEPRQPLRLVLDSRLRTPATARVLQGGAAVIATCIERQTALSAHDELTCPVWTLPGRGGRIDLDSALARLAQAHCNEVLIEAGPTLAGAFMQANLIDEMIVYIAPKLLGSDARPMLQLPLVHLYDARELEVREVVQMGQDLRLILVPREK